MNLKVVYISQLLLIQNMFFQDGLMDHGELVQIRHIFFSWITYPYSEVLSKRKVDLFRPSGGGYLSSWIRFFRLLDH